MNARTAPPNKVGDKLTSWVSCNHAPIDHYAKGREGVRRVSTGKPTHSSGDKQELTLMTPEGERSFPVQSGEYKRVTTDEGG